MEILNIFTDMPTEELIITIVGYSACVAMIFGYLPQTIRTIRTRSTDDIAIGTFLLMGIGSILFVVQGYLLDNLPLLLTNLCTTLMSTIIFSIKMYNDHFKKDSNPKK
ncbi:MAG: PQ-loop repeat-containing protein [Muribaculaceae bacterium]